MRIVYDVDAPMEAVVGGGAYAHRVDKIALPSYPGTKISMTLFWDKDSEDHDAIYIEGSATNILTGLRTAIEQIEDIERVCRELYDTKTREQYPTQHAEYKRRNPKRKGKVKR